ncbi:MAG: LysE family translocator [Rhodospirillales bacterium]|nr:LysE family translocator [Rhodospirillales bacterium]MDE2199958.1 LysE family translocator [Rhodospirillales bacterium]MDE2575854.1 LysE family translocator [Rhodospirillales bacterium]
MTVQALLMFALALAVVAGSPGPSVAALVARVLTGGVRDVLPFLAAMWIGEAVWLTVAVTGLAMLARGFADLFLVIKFAGALYLLVLAWRMWHAPADPAGAALPEGRRPWRMFLAGMMVTLGNPKIMVFYLALLPTLIDLRHVGTGSWAVLTLTMLVVLMLVDIGWALLAARARRWLTSRRAVRLANRTSATVMAGAALTIAAR